MNPPLPSPASALAMWGGVECTYNRVGERYFSQLEWNGHQHRTDDLERFTELGLKTLRYPVLWEMVESAPEVTDWTFSDDRLTRMRELGIRPIAGLVHHGSGPRHASIETDAFAPGLAKFARRVAERFPWIDAYTPVNEPLTTARFCGLYGIWYPHAENHRTFVRIVANECRAIILSMQAIRQVNPAAQLVQPDDLGYIYSTPAMHDEAAYQNERRWLAWDLLHGRVGREHALWHYLLTHGLNEMELIWFQENACPPDIIGINHYPTSDRFLDENVHLYPAVIPASNETHMYADVEAVRVRMAPTEGFYARLMEAWNRYQTPLAITESHLGCTREEQIRWLAESWNAAERARLQGAEVVAVTAWSLLGSYNWNTLVTRDGGHYEPGVFDVRGPEPRPTAIAGMLRDLTDGRGPSHPALELPGWWHRPDRLWARGDLPKDAFQRSIPAKHGRLLILGTSTPLGQAFVRACDARHLPYHSIDKEEIYLPESQVVDQLLMHLRPWAVINATLPSKSDRDYRNSLAAACKKMEIGFLCLSSGMVFDGTSAVPYLESHCGAPRNARGRNDLAMERTTLALHASALVIRTGLLFGHDSDFSKRHLKEVHQGVPVEGREDPLYFSGTYVPDMVGAALDLLVDRASGIWHLVNSGLTNWLDHGKEIAASPNFGCTVPIPFMSGASPFDFTEDDQRILGTERGQILPNIDDAYRRMSDGM